MTYRLPGHSSRGLGIDYYTIRSRHKDTDDDDDDDEREREREREPAWISS